MPALLFHWRREVFEAERARWRFPTYELYSNSDRLLSADVGDPVWVFTRNARKRYVLAAWLRVRERLPTGRGARPHGVRSARGHALYFKVESGPDIEDIIRHELGIEAQGEPLGRSFRGPNHIRLLSADADFVLSRFARAHYPSADAAIPLP